MFAGVPECILAKYATVNSRRRCGGLDYFENDVMSDNRFCFVCSCTTTKHKHVRHICTYDTTLAGVCFHNSSGLPDLKCLHLSCKANSKSNSGGKGAASPWQPVKCATVSTRLRISVYERRKREGRSFAEMSPCLEGNARRWEDWFLLMLRRLLRKRNR